MNTCDIYTNSDSKTLIEQMGSSNPTKHKVKKRKEKGNEPARVPLAAARLRPFFFKMKLEPMNKLEDTANTKPISLSDTILSIDIGFSFYLSPSP